MRGRLVRALGVTALVFAGCFAVVLGALVFGEPGVPSLRREPGRPRRGRGPDRRRRPGRARARRLRRGPVDPGHRRADPEPGRRRGTDAGDLRRDSEDPHQGKPVVASMGSVAASGGYYLAAAATRIVANPGTLTGSIGVIMQLAEIEGLLKKVGVRYEVIKAGRYKDSASFARPMTPEERARPPGRARRHARPVRRRRSPRAAGSARSGCARWRTGACTRDGWRRTSGSSTPRGAWTRRSALAGELGGVPGKPRLVRPRRAWRLLDLADLAGGECALAGSDPPVGPVRPAGAARSRIREAAPLSAGLSRRRDPSLPRVAMEPRGLTGVFGT